MHVSIACKLAPIQLGAVLARMKSPYLVHEISYEFGLLKAGWKLAESTRNRCLHLATLHSMSASLRLGQEACSLATLRLDLMEIILCPLQKPRMDTCGRVNVYQNRPKIT